MKKDALVKTVKFFSRIDYLSIFRHCSSSLAIAAAMAGLYLILPFIIFTFFFIITVISTIDHDGFFSQELLILIGQYLLFILVFALLFLVFSLLLALIFIIVFSPMHALVNKLSDYRNRPLLDRFTTRIIGTILASFHLFFWMVLITYTSTAGISLLEISILAGISGLISFTYGLLYGMQEAITSFFGWTVKKIISFVRRNKNPAKFDIIQFPTNT